MSSTATQAHSNANGYPTKLPIGYPKADARGDAMKTVQGKTHYFGKHGTQESVDRFNRSPVGQAFAAAAATGNQVDQKTWKDLDDTLWLIGAVTGLSGHTLVRRRLEVGGVIRHEPIPGKVRAKKVPMSSKFSCEFVWVYHAEDAQMLAESFALPPHLNLAKLGGLKDFTIVNAGAGYQVGDVLTLQGGEFTTAAQINVSGVDGDGGVTHFTVRHDVYSAPPPNPAISTGGSGAGFTAKFDFKMGRFGRWKIDGLDEKKSERKKRHWWNVTCTCPRRTKKSVPARALLEGKSRSCGCIEHRFNSSVVNRKRAEKAKQFVDGIEYWTPRIVMEFLDIDWTTLDELWSATKPRVNSEGRRKRPGCPHLPNRRPIGTRKLREGYNLEVRHFVADDCRLARKVLDQKIGIPTPSHATRLEEALIELGYSKGTLYRRLRRVGACVENISGHRKGGRPQEYVFVPNLFIKREKPQWEPARLSTGAESVNGIEALHAKIDEHSEKLNGMHAVATETNAKLDGVKAAVDSVPVAVAESNARLGAKLDEHHAAVGAKLDKLKARPTDDEDKNHRERIQSLNVDVLWDQHVIVGASGEARFDRGDVQWPIVNSAIKALPGQFTWDTVLAVYPGVESKDARQAAITRINEKLVNVSLRIEKRKIIRI